MARNTRHQWFSWRRFASRGRGPNRPAGALPFHRRLRIEPLEDRRLLSITVDTLVDELDLDFSAGDFSLREAIAVATPGETIDFSVTGTIDLALGELSIDKNLTINGPGANLLLIDASDLDPTPLTFDANGIRVFSVDDGLPGNLIDVELIGLFLIGGDVLGSGGAIYNLENLTVRESTIGGNGASSFGAGISSYLGDLTVIRSTIANNSTVSSPSSGFGGGIANVNGNLTVIESTIRDNFADQSGGGIRHQAGDLTIINSTISRNSADVDGGGIQLLLDANNTAIIAHSTISFNNADSNESSSGAGGGIAVDTSSTGTVQLDHTIVAGNFHGDFIGDNPDDVFGSFAARYSLIRVDTGASIADLGGSLIGTAASPINPLLGALANHGGPTLIHALFPGSPALDAGDPAAVAGVPEFDQRGAPFVRVVGDRIDMGAYEAQAVHLVVDTLDDEDDGNHSSGDLSLREAIEQANANQLFADTITFDPSIWGGTILLTEGQLEITDSMTIEGPGASLLTIDASGSDPTPHEIMHDGTRVFAIVGGGNAVEFFGLTLTGGDDPDSQGDAIESDPYGESGDRVLSLTDVTISGNGTGIDVHEGSLSLTDSTISGNAASAIRGLYLYGITLTRTTISDNGGYEGSIMLDFCDLTVTDSTISGNNQGIVGVRTSVRIVGSTISGNSAGGNGGGIALRGSFLNDDLTVIDSTISGNSTSGNGGGIYFRGQASGDPGPKLTIINSTISGNSAGRHGGGIFAGNFISATPHYASLSITDSTITQNQADSDNDAVGSGGGLFIVPTIDPAVIDHTIIAGNMRGSATPQADDISGALAAEHSLVGADAGATITDNGGNLIGTSGSPIDPLLGPLAGNGGPTMTHALLAGSPAIDAGDTAALAGVGDVPLYDQRGNPFTRVYGGRIDMGALERQPNPLPGDGNFNGVVDDGDYDVWKSGFGSTTDLSADFNGDGVVGVADYTVWRDNLGQTLPGAASGGGGIAVRNQPQALGVQSTAGQASSGTQAATLAEPIAQPLRTSGEDERASQGENPPPPLAPRSLPLAPRRQSVRSAMSSGPTIAANRRDAALVAWLASSTGAEPEVGTAELDRPSTRSVVESLDVGGLGVLDAAYGIFDGHEGAGRRWHW